MQITSQARRSFVALAGLALLVLLMFADVLLAGGSQVLGNLTTDLRYQFIAWRQFGFSELANGNLALWNPHVFGGAPYFGGFQAALLYPPNVLFLVLPLPQAVNWSIALHVFLMGAFMYAWMRWRGLGTEASFFAGVLAMFGGTYFLHIYAGHLPNLSAMVWAPLILMVIDAVFSAGLQTDSSKVDLARWLMLGMVVVALQILAGHPQYVFITAIAAGVYTVLRLFETSRRAFAFGALLAVGVGGLLLSAVQWMGGLAANQETIRSVPLPFEFAATYAFPPENFLTFFAPSFFGNWGGHLSYWGRFEFWEMSLFIGVTGFVCASYGAIRGDRPIKALLLAAAIMLVLALGRHTPLYHLLYTYVPGFDKFRGMSKFVFPASLFLIAVAAHGLDHLSRVAHIPFGVHFGIWILAGGALLAAASVRIFNWQILVQAVMATGESYMTSAAGFDADFLSRTRAIASLSLAGAGVIAAALAVLLHRAGAARRTPTIIIALAIVEMFVFARDFRDTFDAKVSTDGVIASYLSQHPGDYRILNTNNPNGGSLIGAQDIWGGDPGVVRRYAEFMSFTQGGEPDKVTQFIAFRHMDSAYRMLRLRYAFFAQNGEIKVKEIPDPMPRLQLISQYLVLPERDEIFTAMRQPGFDPSRQLILEQEPLPKPVGWAPDGAVRVTASATDWMEIEADLKSPAILLMTEVYTDSWRAVALAGSAQQHYQLMPANYILRAIPLSAGNHKIRVEYAPIAFRVGLLITVGAWVIFLAVVTVWMMLKLRNRRRTLARTTAS